MALNVKTSHSELNLIHNSILLPVLFEEHPENIWSQLQNMME
jgi:hypothetical protein